MELLDTSFPHEFHPSLDLAERESLREAADTGGILLRIKSVRFEPKSLLVTGVIPVAALAFEHPAEFASHVRPRSLGTMRLIGRSLSQPAPDDLGYLVLQTPIVATGQVPESEDGDSIWVTVSVPQATAALEPGVIGAPCCSRCNRPITRPRLLAIPNTKVCTNCQQKKETKC
jgi:DksA/TraR C4-type zinc finger protein